MRSWWLRGFDDLAIRRPGAPPRRWDWVVAVGLAGLVGIELVGGDYDLIWLRLLPAAVAIGVLPWRRQFPVHAAIGGFFAQFVFEVYARIEAIDDSTTTAHVIAGLMLIYALCRWASLQRVAVGMAVTMALVSATEMTDGDDLATDVLFVVPWIILALFALAMRYRARLTEHREHEIRLAERNALARDLHDSVAHHVSAIAVQAQAAQYIAATRPDEARTIMANVEAIANTTIDEMRRMVGILRSDADHTRTVASTLAGLVTSTGHPTVTLTGETNLEHLPAPVAAALFRIAQEAVTNARRHSRDVTFIDVRLTSDERSAELEVINDGIPSRANAGSGYGLIGMSERVDALGGNLETGPRPASGWRILARIPLRRAHELGGSKP